MNKTHHFTKLIVSTIASILLSVVSLSGAQAADTVINGRVLDEQGKPVARAQVTAIIQYDAGGRFERIERVDKEDTTGPAGGFSIKFTEQISEDRVQNKRLTASKGDKSVTSRDWQAGKTNNITLNFAASAPEQPAPATATRPGTGTRPPTGGQPTGIQPSGGVTSPGASSGAGTGSTTAALSATGVSSSVKKIAERIAPAPAGEGKTLTLADRLQGDQPVARIWRTILNITNGVVILVFLVLGFATIFHVQVDTYGVKKALPNVIIAIILANFSLFITRMVVDVSNIFIVSIVNSFENGSKGLVDSLTGGFVQGGLETLGDLIDGFNNLGKTGSNSLELIETTLGKLKWIGAAFTAFTAGGYLLLGAVILAALAIILPSIFVLILAILFYVRTYVILALAAVAPLAFISFALPASQVLFRQWWTQLVRWAMLGPIAFFMLWLAIQFGNAFGEGFEFGIYLIYLTFLYLAISLPFKMGGVITANVGKYLGKPLRQAGGFGARWYGRTGEVLSGSISGLPGIRAITRGQTLTGMVKGWGKEADYYYQLEAGKQTEAGRVFRDIVASAAKSGFGILGRLGPAIEAARIRSSTRLQGPAREHIQPMFQAMLNQFRSFDEAKKFATAAGRPEEKAAALAAAIFKGAQAGKSSSELQRELHTMVSKDAKLRGPEAQAAFAALQEELKNNPIMVTTVVNPLRPDGSIRGNEEISAEQSRLMGNKIDQAATKERRDEIITKLVESETGADGKIGNNNPLIGILVNRLRKLGNESVPESVITSIRNTSNINITSEQEVTNQLETRLPNLAHFFERRPADVLSMAQAAEEAQSIQPNAIIAELRRAKVGVDREFTATNADHYISRVNAATKVDAALKQRLVTNLEAFKAVSSSSAVQAVTNELVKRWEPELKRVLDNYRKQQKAYP